MFIYLTRSECSRFSLCVYMVLHVQWSSIAGISEKTSEPKTGSQVADFIVSTADTSRVVHNVYEREP